MSEPSDERALESLAGELRLLRPVAPAVDRERLWYEAGRASAEKRRIAWLWPATTAAMTLVAASLAVVIGIRGIAPDQTAVSSTVQSPDAPMGQQFEDQQPMALDAHWQIRRAWNEHGQIGASEVPSTPRSTESPPMTNWHWRRVLISS